ncbi:MAG: asparagine synthetase B, partial [Candidatus Bathyarchaeota archaeon]|nr:asparagine synthetase B [Candidatus Bathyarchaeota archaeon]
MGALVAAVHKQQKNVAPLVVNMLCELKHRGTDGHGIATPTKTKTAQSLDQLNSEINSNIVLGHNFSQIVPRDHPQPIQGNGFTLVFEGRLFPSPNRPGVSEAQEIAEKLAKNPLTNAYNVIEKMEGSYVFAIAQPDKLIAGRDLFGETPLYYGENESVCALASERKALWKIGITDPKPFPPGQLATVDSNGFVFRAAKTLNRPPKTVVDMETASEALQLLLLDSTRRRVCDLESVAVAFSGGVDSTVVAALAKEVGLDVQLIAVGLENQPEVMFAKQAAEALELPIHIQTYSVGALKATLAEALWLTEENHAVNACIAVPFYWLAETASKLGHPVLLAGQGADELFGGYKRYATEYS